MTETNSGKPVGVIDRTVIRALLIGPGPKVLLLRAEDDDGLTFWFTPCGALDERESAMDALKREVNEELGGFTDFDLGDIVWEGDTEFIWRGTTYRQHESIRLCRTQQTPTFTGPFGIPEEGILEARWWHVADVTSALNLRPHNLDETIKRCAG